MKILRLLVKMISMNNENGEITPIRFQINNTSAGPITVKVDKIINISGENTAGSKIRTFHCQSKIKGQIRDFELKYDILSCKWYLYKM